MDFGQKFNSHRDTKTKQLVIAANQQSLLSNVVSVLKYMYSSGYLKEKYLGEIVIRGDTFRKAASLVFLQS